MAHRSLGHRAPLLWLVLPYAAGLALARSGLGGSVTFCLTGAALAAILALGFAGRHFSIWAGSIIVAVGLAGAASYSLHRARLSTWDQLPPREAHLVLRIDRSFASTFPQQASGLATIMRTDSHLTELRGQPLAYSLRLAKGATAPLPTAEIEVLGILELLPEHPPRDSFDGYLAAAGMNFRLTRGQVFSETHAPSAYRQFCARMAERFGTSLGIGVEEKRPDLTGVLRAMLLGKKDELSEEQDALFMQSGTMHLFAISGLHIGVIAVVIHALLSLARLPRPAKYLIGLVALGLYVNITGDTPSAVRAFSMVALLQAAFMFRVPSNPLAALAASALLVLAWAPLQLFSASFQMSYGIVAALLLLGLPLAERWGQRWPLFAALPQAAWGWRRHVVAYFWRKLLAACAIGLSTILFSLLSGVLYFGIFTPGALVANLMLIPIAMFVIIAGVGSLLCGLVGFTTGTVLCNHAAVLVLWMIDEGIRLFVGWPGVHHAAEFRAEWIGPLAMGLLLGALLYGYSHRWAANHGGGWPPLLIVAVALIFGVNFR